MTTPLRWIYEFTNVRLYKYTAVFRSVSLGFRSFSGHVCAHANEKLNWLKKRHWLRVSRAPIQTHTHDRPTTKSGEREAVSAKSAREC